MKTITHFDSIFHFSTAHLYAKKLEQTDLDQLISMDSNVEVMQTLGGTRAPEQTKSGLESNLKHWQENQFGAWMFYLKETGEWVGRAALRQINIDGIDEIEVAYALLPQFWNRGLATEMAKACCEIAFEVLRFNNVVCFTLTTNDASKRVMEKAGFVFEKNIIHAGFPHVFYRLKNPRKVEVVPYQSNWPEYFLTEAKKIKLILGEELKEIHHIGSTSIPNMPAKPIVDIMIECENLDKISWITQQLNKINYYNIRRHVIPHRSFFTRREDKDMSFNLHILERGDPQVRRHLNFRDYVIAHSDDARDYANLKLKLATLFSDDMNSYVQGKDKLVQEIDHKAKQWPQRRMNLLSANTGPKATDWTQEKIIKAMEANLNVHLTYFSQFLNQIELIRIPGYTIVNSGLPDDTFNTVSDADFSTIDADKKIQEVTDYFSQNHTPFSWWVSPHDKPEKLTEFLVKNNYKNTENNIAMSFDLDAWNGEITPPPELKIIRALDEKTLQDFACVLTNDKESFKKYFSWIASVLTENDPIEYYVGYVNNKPVVRGLICFYAQVAGLHWLSTDPEMRKKGYGAALQQFRLKRAKELGYHVAVLQASEQGYPLYKKLGYQKCGIVSEYKLNEYFTHVNRA
jgi:GrpB-like predicted nucleotidyltransferase (UPF0157 family)/predicted acetyltransferase